MSEAVYHPNERDLTVNGAAQAELHERAAAATQEQFGNRVFVRGVVELSNYCRQNCAYCGMRRENRHLERFRAQAEQIASMLLEHTPPSVTDINIQTGEDPVAARELVLPLIRTLRRESKFGVSVCLGTLSPELYDQLRQAGATIYILKFECADAADFARVEAPGTLSERRRHIDILSQSGWFVSSGFIGGLPGQRPRHWIDNLKLAATLPLHGCSVSPFIPGEDTPLRDFPPASASWTYNCIAAMRLMRPSWVIPAVSALNLAAKDGYRNGLRAGANLVTINLTPEELRGDYVIYKRERFIMTEERVLEAMAAEGLEASRQGLAEFYMAGAAPVPA
jgi:biotin synthase